MIFYRVKEESGIGQYTDGVDKYSIHATEICVENPVDPENNIYIGDSIENAMSYFGLIKKINTENETI